MFEVGVQCLEWSTVYGVGVQCLDWGYSVWSGGTVFEVGVQCLEWSTVYGCLYLGFCVLSQETLVNIRKRPKCSGRKYGKEKIAKRHNKIQTAMQVHMGLPNAAKSTSAETKDLSFHQQYKILLQICQYVLPVPFCLCINVNAHNVHYLVN